MLSPEQYDLIRKNVKVAQAIAHRAWAATSGYDRDDFISWGYLGLMIAVERWPGYCEKHGYVPYAPDSESWFRTYSGRRIKGQIIDSMRSADPATRRERALVKAIKAGGVDLSLAWDHVSAETIAQQAGMEPDDVRRAVAALVRTPLPLDDVSDDVPTMEVSAEDLAARAALCDLVVRTVSTFHSRWKREVVIMSTYLGMSDVEIVDELDELRADPVLGPHARLWVEHWVLEAREALTHALRALLSQDGLGG